jgi:hypothetical protein
MSVEWVGKSAPGVAPTRSGETGVRRRWLVARPRRVKGARVLVLPYRDRSPLVDADQLPLPSKRTSVDDR